MLFYYAKIFKKVIFFLYIVHKTWYNRLINKTYLKRTYIMTNYFLNKLLYILVGKTVKRGQRRTVWNGIRLAKSFFYMFR